MIRAISPVNGEWVHEYIIAPLEEGLRRINLVFANRNIYSLNCTPLSRKDKAIALITGLALAAFPINTVIWIAWQVFGRPKQLFRERHNPEIELPAAPPLVPQETPGAAAAAEPLAIAPPRPEPSASQPAAAPPLQEEGRRVETLSFKETGSQGVIDTHWKVTYTDSQILVHQHCDEHSSAAVYSLNWDLKEFHATDRSSELSIVVRDTGTVSTSMTKNGITTTKEIAPGLPLVQQKRCGLRGFVLDRSKTKLRFCSILREKKNGIPLMQSVPFAIPMIAEKVGTEDIENVPCLKVEVVSEWGWPYNRKGEFWFDGGGILRKFINPFDNSIGEYSQSGR